jgi:hypothetical protein
MKSGLNLLLAASAAVYFAAAVALLFAPEEIARAFGGAPAGGTTALLQVVGSTLLGFSMLNWMNRFSRVGGILGRPLLVANLAHTATAFLLLVRTAARDLSDPAFALPTALYLLLAVAFGSRLFVATPPDPR